MILVLLNRNPILISAEYTCNNMDFV